MTSTSELAAQLLPARGAAQRATASIAGQLSDSPDADSPSPSNPFREPAHRTTAVKYRYTATGKHLSSPLKGSSSSPERKPDSSALPPHAHKGNAPAVATTSRKRKASPAPLRKDDPTFALSSSPLSSAPTTPIVSTKDLPPSPTLAAKEPILDPPKRLVGKTLSLHALQPNTPKLKFGPPVYLRHKPKKNKPHPQKGTHAWDIGNSVWVLVNQSGVLADNSAHSQNDPEWLMWWPAQIVQKQPLRVSMFGDFPSSSSANRGLCTIFSPSSSNVQSINDDSGAKRFLRTTFRLISLSPDADAGPPTKKPRLDDIASLEARWEAAVQSMDKASTLEQDGLPALLSSYATTGGSFYDSPDDSDADTSDLRRLQKPSSSSSKKSKLTRKLKPQRSRANMKADASGSTPRHGSPCRPDPTLQIPGELILALAPRTGGFYWPAQILQHVPDLKEKYKVKFLDDEEHVITRDRFWTSEEEGFVRCTLGEWESTIKTMDDTESGDEGRQYGADDPNAPYLDDSDLPPPPPPREFEDLSVRAQLAYVKPVLQAILNKEYAPAREKHEAFMRGGPGRVALLKSAGIRGGMDARFIKAVQKAICEWVLGDGGVKPEKLDIVTGSSEVKVTSPKVAPVETLPRDNTRDDKMEGVEGAAVSNDGTANETLPEVAQVVKMGVDGHDKTLAALAPPMNGVTLSPAIAQAGLAPKSQLDLLAEVSQAVATEPSLLPSHPEVPRLKVHLVDIARQDTPSQPSPLTPIPEEDQPLPSRRSVPVVCEGFETLSGVEKLDYCLNILLPESIQQLLLWRSGERTSSMLLSPEEEQRLHDLGARKAAETDWVDDVMRLRAAQARLWGVDLNKKVEEKRADVMLSGTRSRPRRGTVSRP